MRWRGTKARLVVLLAFSGGCGLLGCKADDDAVYGGFPAGLVAPVESTMREVDVNALGEHLAPQHAHLRL
jgi:hypothetical protein